MVAYSVMAGDALTTVREHIRQLPRTYDASDGDGYGPVAAYASDDVEWNAIFSDAVQRANGVADALNRRAGAHVLDARATIHDPSWADDHSDAMRFTLLQFARALEHPIIRAKLDFHIEAVDERDLAVAFTAGEIASRAMLWPNSVPNNIGLPLSSFVGAAVVAESIAYSSGRLPLPAIDWAVRQSRRKSEPPGQVITRLIDRVAERKVRAVPRKSRRIH